MLQVGFPAIGRFLIAGEACVVFQTPSVLQVLPHVDRAKWDHPHRMHTSMPNETDFFALGVHKTTGASHLHDYKLRLAEKT